MIIKTLEKLPKNNDNLFDLTKSGFRPYNTPFVYNSYIVPKEFEMRMDLISNELYKSVEYVDFLLSFNNIINPFNIIEGREIFYISSDIIPNFYATKEVEDEIQQVFLNNSKVKRKDSNRESFISDKRSSLPPTISETKNQQVKIKGDKIIIGGDSFNI